MTTDNRLKLTHLIKKLTDESVEQLLETASKLFAASTTAHPSARLPLLPKRQHR